MTRAARTGSVAGLIGTRVTITGTLKGLAHLQMLVEAQRSRRGRWWKVAAVGSLLADAVMVKKLSDPDYRPGWGYRAWELSDCALWAGMSDSRPSGADVLMVGDALPSALLAGWRFGAGTSAVPVYDFNSPFPPVGVKGYARATAEVLAPLVLPFCVATIVRRARGHRTHWANLTWGLTGTAIGIATSRQRHLLQEETRRLWRARAESMVNHVERAAGVQMAMSSSAGHDFKKTLFALGLAGSEPAMHAAHEQIDWPASYLERTHGAQLLFEASHRLVIEPLQERVRLLSADQVDELQAFLDRSADVAVDGADRVLRVSDEGSSGLRLQYLGNELVLRSDPPPLVARFNPTAITFGVGAMFKVADCLFPFGGCFPAPVNLGLMVNDLLGFARYWRNPPDRDEMSELSTRVTLPTLGAVLLCGTRLARLTDREGRNVYPAAYLVRDMLLVLLPNWKWLRAKDRWGVASIGGAGLIASALRRRNVFSMSRLIIGFGEAIFGLSVLNLFARTVEEADLLESMQFEWFSEQIRQARARGELSELERYEEQLQIARSALEELPSLPQDFGDALRADCDELERWLRLRGTPIQCEAQFGD